LQMYQGRNFREYVLRIWNALHNRLAMERCGIAIPS
jgi:hypothetical protein